MTGKHYAGYKRARMIYGESVAMGSTGQGATDMHSAWGGEINFEHGVHKP